METSKTLQEFSSGEPGLVPPDRLSEIVRTVNALRYDVNALKAGGLDPFRLITTYLFKPTSNAERGGVYKGVAVKLGVGEFDPDEGTTVELDDLGEDSQDASVNRARVAIGVNVREIGETTHDVAFSGFLPLAFPAMLRNVNSDGKLVLLFDGHQWEDCE